MFQKIFIWCKQTYPFHFSSKLKFTAVKYIVL